ncbi:MAG: glycosyltransferase family 4 protein [Candidatus Binatia bacterium]
MSLRVLIVSPYPISPPIHGGRVRALGLARGLARAGATVALLCPWMPWNRRREELEPGLRCHRHLLATNVLPATPLSRLAPSLALLSLQPRSWGAPRRLLAGFSDFDVFQFEFCAHARWMDLVPAGRIVCYSAHNVERDFLAADAERYVLARPSLRRIENLERAAVARSDVVIACTQADLERLSELYGEPGRGVVVPNGYDPTLLGFERGEVRAPARARLELRPTDRAVLFVGGDATHNVEAANFLTRFAAPRLPADTKLLVAGRCAEPAFSADRRFRCFGFVQDLRPLFAAADVAVNPIDFGSGSNVKLLEYLAAGLPVISTPIGVRGLPLPAHPAVRIATRQGFVEALGDPLPASPIDRASIEHLSWHALGADLFRVYEDLLRGRSRSHAANGDGILRTQSA